MKRKLASQSTTDTPPPRMFQMGARGVVLALASATAVTLPVAPVVLRHQSIGLVLLAGLFPGLPLLLIALVLLSIYSVASLLAIAVAAVRIASMRTDPVECLDDLFALITNAPIAFMTRIPLKQKKREAKISGQKNEPPQSQGPPSFEQLFREWPELFEWVARSPGRHARAEIADPSPISEEDESPMAA